MEQKNKELPEEKYSTNFIVEFPELFNNKSKYIEWLIYQDLRKNNLIDEIIL